MPVQRIIAIDPGDVESGYVIVEYNGETITKIIGKGKVENDKLFGRIYIHLGMGTRVAIEMIASYGMPVGKNVFETCLWIGRFIEKFERQGITPTLIYRSEEKMNLCHSQRAKDSNIVQALIDRFAPYDSNKGKGTKANPGFFYGFKKDIWQAFAVAVTYFDLYIKGQKI